MLPPPPRFTLFPYTTLFRSPDIEPQVFPSGDYTYILEIVMGMQGTMGKLIEAVESRSEEHTSELQSRENLVCRLLLEKKKAEDHKKLEIYLALRTQTSCVTS